MNRLTSCCHFPYFADSICPNCGNACQPFDIPFEPLPEVKAYWPELPREPIEPYIPKPIVILPPRWKNEDDAYENYLEQQFLKETEDDRVVDPNF